MRKHYLLLIIYFLSCSSVYSLSLDEANLLRKDYQLYQAWSLSRDYYFGITLNADPINALVWQLVYTNLLPHSYPQKNQLLAFYQRNLTLKQIQDAQVKALRIGKAHKFGTAFTEMELHKVYPLRDAGYDRAAPEVCSANTLSRRKKTGLIGRAYPWKGIESGDIILCADPVIKVKNNSPCLNAYLPLTVTNEGLFYTTGLNPGRYKLFFYSAGKRAYIKFSVKEAEIRGIGRVELT